MNLVYQFNDFLKNISVDYAICGGSAIDLFVGYKTRTHKDLDVAVFWEDRDSIVQYMLSLNWRVFEPCGCEYLHEIKNIEAQKRTKTNIWCIKPDNTHYTIEQQEKDMFAVVHDGTEQKDLNYIEFLFNKRKDGYFLYSRNGDIKREMDKAILKFDDIFYLSPEFTLLYKSTAINNPDYQNDFVITLPLLDFEKREWLKNALNCMFPEGHEWLNKLILL